MTIGVNVCLFCRLYKTQPFISNSIRLVNLLAAKGKFGSFAYYCWGAGIVALILSLIGWTMI